MSPRALPLLLVGATAALAACGGDDAPGTDAGQTCAPPAAQLPTMGPLLTVADLELPANCVAGGLVDLPGRWFVADLSQTFTFSYPKFAGSCTEGFREPFATPDDNDETDGFSRFTWSDGTRYFARSYWRFEFGGGMVFEFVRATGACLLPDGTMAYSSGRFDTDNGERVSHLTGERFAVRDAPALGLTEVGRLSTYGDPLDPQIIEGLNVVVDAGIAYVAGLTGLDIIDVTDPARPVHRAHMVGPDDDGFNDVRVVRGGGRVIAFASALNGDVTSVLDVTDPTAPFALPAIGEYSHSVQVRVDGARTLLYLANYTNSIPVFDVTIPAQPVRLGAPLVPGEEHGIHDLFVDGDVIYANNTTGGMVAIDVSAGLDQPAVELGRIATTYSHASWAATINGRKIVIHGDEGMTPDGGAFMRILDGDPTSPTYMQELSRYRSRTQVGIHNMEIVGTRAYVAHYQDGVRIVELADPTQPVEVAHFNTWDEATAPGSSFEGAVGYRPGANGLSYVADIASGLIILRETP